MSNSSVAVKISEVYELMTRRVKCLPIRNQMVQLPKITDLRSTTLTVAESIPTDIPMIISRRLSKDALAKLLPKATHSTEPSKPIFVENPGTIPPPKLPSPQRRRALRSLFTENIPPRSPRALILPAPYIEGILPSLKATVSVCRFDDDDEDNPLYDTLSDIAMIYDTGAQITVISEDLLSSTMREQLGDNQIYGHGKGVQISINIQFTNTVLALE